MDIFIGKEFKTTRGNILKVVNDNGKSGHKKKYGCKCNVCSLDKELFEEIFYITKYNLLNGSIPCGCSKSPKWLSYQYKVLIKRALCRKEMIAEYPDNIKGKTNISCQCNLCGKQSIHSANSIINYNFGCKNCWFDEIGEHNKLDEDVHLNRIKSVCDKKGYKFVGFAENYKNKNTKLKIQCHIHGDWSVSYSNFVYKGSGCPLCAGTNIKDLETVVSICKSICKKYGYEFISFPNGYKNKNSKMEYYCTHHGIKSSSYHNFVYNGSRCIGCSNRGYDVNSYGYYYVYVWTKGESEFIKHGITSNPEQRLLEQKRKTEYTPKIVFLKRFANGNIPRDIERFIQERYETRFVDKDVFGDGYTETIDPKFLNDIIMDIKKYEKYYI